MKRLLVLIFTLFWVRVNVMALKGGHPFGGDFGSLIQAIIAKTGT